MKELGQNRTNAKNSSNGKIGNDHACLRERHCKGIGNFRDNPNNDKFTRSLDKTE